MPPRAAAKPTRRLNPIGKGRPEIKGDTIFTQKAAAQAAAKAQQRSRRRNACPNPTCDDPNVEDGICHGCGMVVDDSNIVSEVQFGESSSGAAVVQGSYLGADQGGARSLGPGLRGSGMEGEGREATIREGKREMQNAAYPLHIQENIVSQAVQILKLAVGQNFIQGRNLRTVSMVCLYSACRMHKPCRVMLIDFADHIKINVFKLGRTFKALHKVITLNGGLFPVLPEDLIWRFAAKLEFGNLCDKVAEDAVRMVQRMSIDWMVMGRRPSGVCGACLILAARMNNFRRTITEVVYIVKVTTHTIQKRLDEFKMTPSSALTVEEFLNNEFLSEAHDPPSFYEKTEEFKATKKKRKRKAHEAVRIEDRERIEVEGIDTSNKRRKTVVPQAPLRRDAEGFAIPALPSSAQAAQSEQASALSVDPNIDPNLDPSLDFDLVDEHIQHKTATSFDQLVEEFGDAAENVIVEAPGSSSNTAKTKQGRPVKIGLGVRIDPKWAEDEGRLEREMSEMVSDPSTIEHAVLYAQAKGNVDERMADHARAQLTQREVNMDIHIGEDEFADDIEVQNFILSPEEAAQKEKIWVNANKEWLRTQQIKEFKKKQEENGPPKSKRNRKKKPRMGEGQTEHMDPADAAIATMERHKLSSKLNYDRIRSMFPSKSASGSALGSTGASRASSELSTADSSADGEGSVATSAAEEVEMTDTGATKADSVAESEGDPADYISPHHAGPLSEEPEVEETMDTSWKAALERRNHGDGDEDEEPEDNNEYLDTGYGDDELPDFDDDAGAFSGPEEEEEYE